MPEIDRTYIHVIIKYVWFTYLMCEMHKHVRVRIRTYTLINIHTHILEIRDKDIPTYVNITLMVGMEIQIHVFIYVHRDYYGSSVTEKSNNVVSFSSRGPTLDGRIKPDIVCPGI